MRKAGIVELCTFAADILCAIPDRPISFEVFSDEFIEMNTETSRSPVRAPNAMLKIPIANTQRASLCADRRLAHQGVKVNVTAIMTLTRRATSWMP